MNTGGRGQELLQTAVFGGGEHLALVSNSSCPGGTDMQVTTREGGQARESGLQTASEEGPSPRAPTKSPPHQAFQPPRILCPALTSYCNEKQIPL